MKEKEKEKEREIDTIQALPTTLSLRVSPRNY